MTTIMDNGGAPAAELAALYADRWVFEAALHEVKTHQRGPRVMLGSKSPMGFARGFGPTCAPTMRSAPSWPAAADPPPGP